jgi:hypothetical protein
MDLNDFRRIVNQLDETARLGEDPAIESLIEETLKGMDPHDAGLVRDALDVLKLHKRLSLRSWILGLMDYRSAGTENLSADQARQIILLTVKTFRQQVFRKSTNEIGDEIWVWNTDTPAAPREGPEAPPVDPAQAVAKAKREMLNAAQKMDSFSVTSLARTAMRCGVDSHTAKELANQFVMDNERMIDVIDSDNLRWRKPRGGTNYSDLFRGYAANALNRKDLRDEGE